MTKEGQLGGCYISKDMMVILAALVNWDVKEGDISNIDMGNILQSEKIY